MRTRSTDTQQLTLTTTLPPTPESPTLATHLATTLTPRHSTQTVHLTSHTNSHMTLTNHPPQSTNRKASPIAHRPLSPTFHHSHQHQSPAGQCPHSDAKRQAQASERRCIRQRLRGVVQRTLCVHATVRHEGRVQHAAMRGTAKQIQHAHHADGGGTEGATCNQPTPAQHPGDVCPTLAMYQMHIHITINPQPPYTHSTSTPQHSHHPHCLTPTPHLVHTQPTPTAHPPHAHSTPTQRSPYTHNTPPTLHPLNRHPKAIPNAIDDIAATTSTVTTVATITNTNATKTTLTTTATTTTTNITIIAGAHRSQRRDADGVTTETHKSATEVNCATPPHLTLHSTNTAQPPTTATYQHSPSLTTTHYHLLPLITNHHR